MLPPQLRLAQEIRKVDGGLPNTNFTLLLGCDNHTYNAIDYSTATPTVIISATLASIKTVIAAGTTTVVVNGKRDVEQWDGQLEDRAVDFAQPASMSGFDLAITSKSSACSCFMSSISAAQATSTVFGKSTATVAVAQAIVTSTTTVKAVTMTSTNPMAILKTTSTAPTTSLSFVSLSSSTSKPTSAASQSVISGVLIVSSSFFPVSTVTNSAELSSLSSEVSSALSGSTTIGPASASQTSGSSTSSGAASSSGAGTNSGTQNSAITSGPVSSSSSSSSPAAASSSSSSTVSAVNDSSGSSANAMTCGVGVQPYNFSNYTLPSTYNGYKPNSTTRFSACHSTIGGNAVCSSCGKCSTTVCTRDSDCASGSACILNSACVAAGTAVCLQMSDSCYS